MKGFCFPKIFEALLRSPVPEDASSNNQRSRESISGDHDSVSITGVPFKCLVRHHHYHVDLHTPESRIFTKSKHSRKRKSLRSYSTSERITKRGRMEARLHYGSDVHGRRSEGGKTIMRKANTRRKRFVANRDWWRNYGVKDCTAVPWRGRPHRTHRTRTVLKSADATFGRCGSSPIAVRPVPRKQASERASKAVRGAGRGPQRLELRGRERRRGAKRKARAEGEQSAVFEISDDLAESACGLASSTCFFFSPESFLVPSRRSIDWFLVSFDRVFGDFCCQDCHGLLGRLIEGALECEGAVREHGDGDGSLLRHECRFGSAECRRSECGERAAGPLRGLCQE